MGNRLALVTGASSGIGYNLAKVFAEKGFDLIITSDGPRLEKAEVDFRALGANVTSIHADLATPQGVDNLWKQVQTVTANLDAAAINAGVGVGGRFVETDLDAELNLIRLNVESTVHLAKHIAKDMVARGDGRILFTASIAGEMVAPYEAVYAASKAFVLSFAKSLREELKDTGVSVTALQPGPTDTDFFHRAGMDNTEVGQKGKKDSNPYDVAQQGYDALMSGDKHVYAADLKVKIQGAVAHLVPDALKSVMHEKMSKPQTEQETK